MECVLVETHEGNPTRSIQVNNLIKQVKKKEVRKQGVVLQTQGPMTEREFRLLHTVLRDPKNNSMWQYGMSAMVNFQFHIIIGRIDDTTQVLIDHI
jgi:DNA-binding response OmpR family regulator